MKKIVEVKDLKVYYNSACGKVVRACDGVSFDLFEGETLGLVGESGCGKTTLGFGLLNMLPPSGHYGGGSILVKGDDIVPYEEQYSRNHYRWKKVAMVFQGAMNVLTPVFTVGNQMGETLKKHKDMEEEEAEECIIKYLSLVGLPEGVRACYPYELSGGMKQRVVIAMALFLEPDFVILDEPTTALDVVVQAQILNLLKELKERLHLSFIFVTHDLATEAEIADRVMVMYAGKVAEIGSNEQIYGQGALHPYTKSLLASIPRLHQRVDSLAFIPGIPPDLSEDHSGCLFAPRCSLKKAACERESPPVREVEPGHFVACWEVKK